ncbi:MAG TPA: hypothetical protein VIT92_05220 [Burkholderiaceae bacterium]
MGTRFRRREADALLQSPDFTTATRSAHMHVTNTASTPLAQPARHADNTDPPLRRAAILLLLAGLLDTAAVAYAYAYELPYQAIGNVLFIASALFIWRGSILTAALVRTLVAVMVALSLPTILYVSLVHRPLDLFLTQLRLHGIQNVMQEVAGVPVLALLAYTVFELARSRAVRDFAGNNRFYRVRIALICGSALGLVVTFFFYQITSGQNARRATSIAAARLGPAYRYHIASLRFTSVNGRSSGVAEVTAWNNDRIVKVPVSWKD